MLAGLCLQPDLIVFIRLGNVHGARQHIGVTGINAVFRIIINHYLQVSIVDACLGFLHAQKFAVPGAGWVVVDWKYADIVGFRSLSVVTHSMQAAFHTYLFNLTSLC